MDFSVKETRDREHEDIRIEAALKAVYGDLESSNETFPRELPPNEADRRYLWTDAFGMIGFMGLAARQPARAAEFHQAGCKLRDAVVAVLGKPASPSFPMKPAASSSSLPFVGLRIGKVEKKRNTDAGMMYDGQYAHYFDKFLLALVTLGDCDSLDLAAQLLLDAAPAFITEHGVHWKLNVDCRPVAALGQARVHGDTLLLAIAATLIAKKRPQVEAIRDTLVGLLLTHHFEVAVTADPLGWGLSWLELAHINQASWKARVASTLIQAAPFVFTTENFQQLRFRLYGAVIGAQLSGDEHLKALAARVLEAVGPQEEMAVVGASEHSSIDKVMYALALDPSVLLLKRAGLIL